MKIAIAGAHGQIAQRLTLKLVAAGHSVVGLIRNPDHAWEIKELGADPSLCDLESDSIERVAEALGGADAAVFAAGAGPGSGDERKLTVDRDGAVKLIEAARLAGVDRYVIISAVGAEDPPEDGDMAVYLRAKAEADRAVQASGLSWTILRPGTLTDDDGTGRADIGADSVHGKVSRDDVAAVALAVLSEPRSAGQILYVNGGDEAIDAALSAAIGA